MQIKELAQTLKLVVEKTLDEKTAIAFSGGLDSATIAKIAKEKSEVELITVGLKESHDIEAAKETANELGLELEIIYLDKEKILEDYEICWKMMPGTLTEMELMVGAYECCKMAKEKKCKTILFGSGAEENFIGYSKYYEMKEKGMELEEKLVEEISTLPERDLKRTNEVAKMCGVEAKYPFMDKELILCASKFSIEERMDTTDMKKPILRKAAKLLGVPKCAYERPKKAMQYGSGIHKILLEAMRKKEINPQAPKKPF